MSIVVEVVAHGHDDSLSGREPEWEDACKVLDQKSNKSFVS